VGTRVFVVLCYVFLRILDRYTATVATSHLTATLTPPPQPPIFLIKRAELRRHEVPKYEYETTWTGGCDLLQHCAVEDLFSTYSCGAQGRDRFAVPVVVIMYHNDN